MVKEVYVANIDFLLSRQTSASADHISPGWKLSSGPLLLDGPLKLHGGWQGQTCWVRESHW